MHRLACLLIVITGCGLGAHAAPLQNQATIRRCATRLELSGAGHAISGGRAEIRQFPPASRFSDEWLGVEWVLEPRALLAHVENRTEAAISIDSLTVGYEAQPALASGVQLAPRSSRSVPLVRADRSGEHVAPAATHPVDTTRELQVELRMRVDDRDCHYEFRLTPQPADATLPGWLAPSLRDPVRDPEIPAVRVSGRQPEYPKTARSAGASGIVVLEIVIETDGRVSGVRVLKPLPFGLSEAAAAAAGTWRYEPARSHGKPIRSVQNVPVSFPPDDAVTSATLRAIESCSDDSLAPGRGHLVIHGGGHTPEALNEFIRLAGGRNARVVVIPTAAGRTDYDAEFASRYFRQFRERGVSDIRLLHTTDRRIADSDVFVEPLAAATGVWFTGGRQWRLADAYLDTRTERALWKLLARGGVIGGGSAGATIQGSYLVRGDSRGALPPMGDHERGFGFLKNSAIDQHLLRRNRQFDLLEVIRAHPTLLGIGLDDDAAIVAHCDEFRVIGRHYVAVYDPRLVLANGTFYFLQGGERFRLSTRTPLSANGETLWMPHIQPRAALTPEVLRDIAGEYGYGDDRVVVDVADGRIRAAVCGDSRELIALSPELFYDSADGSKVTIQRDRDGATVLTWSFERMLNQRLCPDDEIRVAKAGSPAEERRPSP